MDAATLHALNIFAQERHPSNMGIGAVKEGFSVFGLVNKCVTKTGRRLLKQWFLKPLASLAPLQERLDAVEALLQSPDLVKAVREVLKKVRVLEFALAPTASSRH